MKLLQKKDVKNFIETSHKKSNLTDEVIKGFKRLAFGSAADCIKLIYKTEITDLELENMDLFSVSEIKKPKDGSLEIKFFDRLKALQLLSEITENENNDKAVPFFEAIKKGALAIRGDENHE